VKRGIWPKSSAATASTVAVLLLAPLARGQTADPYAQPGVGQPAPPAISPDMAQAMMWRQLASYAAFAAYANAAAVYAVNYANNAAAGGADASAAGSSASAWLTNGAEVTSVPADGGMAAYFTQGATPAAPPTAVDAGVAPVAATPRADAGPPPRAEAEIPPAAVAAAAPAPDAGAAQAAPPGLDAAAVMALYQLPEAAPPIVDLDAGAVDAAEDASPDEFAALGTNGTSGTNGTRGGGGPTGSSSGGPSDKDVVPVHPDVSPWSVQGWFWALAALQLGALGFGFVMLRRFRENARAKQAALEARRAAGHSMRAPPMADGTTKAGESMRPPSMSMRAGDSIRPPSMSGRAGDSIRPPPTSMRAGDSMRPPAPSVSGESLRPPSLGTLRPPPSFERGRESHPPSPPNVRIVESIHPPAMSRAKTESVRPASPSSSGKLKSIRPPKH
jgi:hypothetical protein